MVSFIESIDFLETSGGAGGDKTEIRIKKSEALISAYSTAE